MELYLANMHEGLSYSSVFISIRCNLFSLEQFPVLSLDYDFEYEDLSLSVLERFHFKAPVTFTMSISKVCPPFCMQNYTFKIKDAEVETIPLI